MPAFLSTVKTKETTQVAQITVMPNKSCLLYYALLPAGSKAPTGAELKAGAVSGNLGYGSLDVVKNVNTSINVNRIPLQEKTNYDLFLWLTDHNGAIFTCIQLFVVVISIHKSIPFSRLVKKNNNNRVDAITIIGCSNTYGSLSACEVASKHGNIIFATYLCKAFCFQFLAESSHTTLDRNTFEGKVLLCEATNGKTAKKKSKKMFFHVIIVLV